VNVLDRYVMMAVLRGVAMVLTVLLAISTVITFVGQADDIGTANYTLAAALTYVALKVPQAVCDLLPVTALVGGLLSLGNMAVHRELVVMRTSGVSLTQLFGAVALAGTLLTGLRVLLGESLAPSLFAYAGEFRAQAINEDVKLADGSSAWFKQGDRIFNLREPGRDLGFGGVMLFDLGPNHELRQIARADSADVDADSEWVLSNYAETRFLPGDEVSADQERTVRRDYDLSPDLLALSVVRADMLDTPGLQRYIRYLEDNDLDATSYLIAYWARMADSVSVWLMTVLALPFAFGSLRSAGTGARLIVGLLIGLGYYVAAQTLASSGQVFELDPIVVAWAPSAVLIAVTAFAFARVR
jgi:lipopolysaccharide export system permease protein